MNPIALSNLNFRRRKVIFLENFQLLPIKRNLLDVSQKLVLDWQSRLIRCPKIKFSTVTHGLTGEELFGAMFLARSISNEKIPRLLSGSTKLNLTRERVGILREETPWTKQELIKCFLTDLICQILDSYLKFEKVAQESRELIQQKEREFSYQFCSRSCPKNRSSPENEDLKLAMACRRLVGSVKVHVIPNKKECFGCLLEFLTGSHPDWQHIQVVR